MLNSFGFLSFVALAIAIGWHIAKWYRPTNEYVRRRTSDPGLWEREYPAELAPLVRKVLGTIRTAFLLRGDDVDRLRPDDRLSAMYRAAYPKRWQADTLEFETLQADLRKKYHIPESALSTLWEMTIGDIIHLCIAHQRVERLTSHAADSAWADGGRAAADAGRLGRCSNLRRP